MVSDLLEELTALIEDATPGEALRLHQALATLSTLCLVRAIEGRMERGQPGPRRKARVLRLAEPPPGARPGRSRRLRSGN
jgi:hypothetical protein